MILVYSFLMSDACQRWSMDQKIEFGPKKFFKKDGFLFVPHSFTNSTSVLSRINMKKFLKARVKKE